MLKNPTKALLIAPALLGILMIVPVKAQEREPINDTFNRAANNSSGTFFDLTNISGQANMIFGWRSWPEGSFPENQISQDAKTTGILLQDVMLQQTGTPPVRTRDLNSPFNTSIKENPSFLRSGGSN